MFNFGGNQYGQQNYGYARPTAVPKPTNPLTKEEMNMLRQKAPQFSLAISNTDALRAICTHRTDQGDALMDNRDGTYTCTICGTTFRPVEAPQETIEEAFRVVLDCLETMKIMYMDIPENVAKDYFQMIPFLEKGPQLYKIALDHYSKYNNSLALNRTYSGGNAFQLYNALMGNGMNMGMGMPGMMNQPMMGQPGMAPGYGMPQQAPVPDATMGAANGVNPFDSQQMGAAASSVEQQVTDNKQYKL